MSTGKDLTTVVSTKGQVILPKVLRDRLNWSAGTRLAVESTKDGIVLKPVPAFAPTRHEDVFGMLPYRGKAKSLADMDEGIVAETKRRHAGDRH